MINNQAYLVSTENRKPISLFTSYQKTNKVDQLRKDEAYAMIELPGNKKQKIEFSWGSSFLSQSSRKWQVPANSTIKVFNQKGNITRTIEP